MPLYKITIEVAAMNRPLANDELLKAFVAGFFAWKTTKRTMKPRALYALMFGAFEKIGLALTHSSFSAYQDKSNRTCMKFEYRDIDPNNILLYLGEVSKSESGVDDFKGFCRRFKCAIKTTVAELERNGHWICDYCSPDGKKETRTEGEEGQPSKSLEDFIREWDKEKEPCIRLT